MNNELLQFYESCGLGVAVYQRIGRHTFEFVYYNSIGRAMDKTEGVDIKNKRIEDVFPDVYENGVIETLENVFLSGQPQQMPNNNSLLDSKTRNYRTNSVQKLPNGFLVSIYFDDIELSSYISKIEVENNILNKALDYTSHNLRGDLSTSLGVLELFDTVDVPLAEQKDLLKVVKTNLEKIDHKIHRLVRLLYMGVNVTEK